MTADVTLQAESVRPLRRRNLTFGLSARILGMVIAAVMTAEILLFLPSIARFRMVYLYQLIESGTLAALAPNSRAPGRQGSSAAVSGRRLPNEALARPPF